MGLDVAGPDLIVARMGVRAAFSNRLGHLGRWQSEQSELVWRSSPGVLDTLVARDLDQGARVSAVLAVPGWFGFVDRWSVRCRLETEHHRIAVVVASSTAGAVHAAANGLLASAEGCVVAVDVSTGVTASLVSIDCDGVTEHGVGGLSPSTIEQADHLDAAIAAMITGLLERCSVTGQHGGQAITAAVVVTDEPRSPLTQCVMARLAAAVAALWPPVVPVVVERSGSVAEGAELLARPSAPRLICAAPCGLGVLVQAGDEVSVLHVLDAGAALPVLVTSLFAVAESDEREKAEVIIEWVEIHLDPRRPPSRALVARGVDELLATIISAQGVLEVDLLVGSDGVLSPLPEACFIVEPGVPLVRAAQASTASPTDPLPDASLTDTPLRVAPRVADTEPADSLLEELARAEASAVSLCEALVCSERLISREVGTDVAIRSVYDLLGCADGADVDTLRAAARQLEEAISRRPADDALAGAISGALRAVRRSFADPTARRYFGGSLSEVEAELVRVVEHVLLVVGEVSLVERRRAAADARAAGLPRDRIDAVLTAMLGPLDAPDDTRATVDATVSVDAADGRCTLTGAMLDGAATIRVVVARSELVT
jgi:hypothetical protein